MRSCRIVSLATVALIVAAVVPSASARAETPPAASPTSPPLSIDSAVPSSPSFDSLALMRVELHAIDSVHVVSSLGTSQAVENIATSARRRRAVGAPRAPKYGECAACSTSCSHVSSAQRVESIATASCAVVSPADAVTLTEL